MPGETHLGRGLAMVGLSSPPYAHYEVVTDSNQL